MESTIAKPPPANSLRGFAARVWDDPESRSTVVGLIGVIIFYLLLWFIAPYLLNFQSVGSVVRPHASARQFNIEIAPDAFVKPPPKPQPLKFVEANPDAPENTPDKTQNFSDRNQQVAQEKPTPDGKNDMPAIEGQKEIKTSQIVTGQLQQPIEQVEAVPPPPLDTREAEKTVTPPKQEQNPLAGFEKKEGENKDGFASNLSKFTDNMKPIPNRIEGVKTGTPLQDAPAVEEQAIDPTRPRPRPTIVKTQKTRPAIFTEQLTGTSNMGLTALDARWSNYGAYLKKLIDIVQMQWENILISGKIYPPSGSTVTVTFVLDSEGKIARIVNVENKSSEQAAHACASAITDRAPYGPWTADMIAMLGKQQEMTFTFYYQ